MLDDIKAFVVGFLTASLAERCVSQKAVREAFRVEVKGFAEFIGINGRTYRYGVVSADDDRTRAIVRKMFDGDFAKFTDAVGRLGASDWDQLHAPELKIHLLKAGDVSLPAAPLHEVDATARVWLQGIYENVHRLNSDWHTGFGDWSEVEYSDTERQREVVESLTRSDMEDVCRMLTRTTQNVMMVDGSLGENSDKLFAEVRERLPGLTAQFPAQGQVELVMAALAAGANMIDEFYAILLLYLARSSARHTFATLPAGAAVHATEATCVGRARFMEEYYDSITRRLSRDWKRATGTAAHDSTRQLMAQVPASTVKDFKGFGALVAEIREKMVPQT